MLCLRRFLLSFTLVALTLLSGFAHAVTYTFAGAQVVGCTLSGTTYTCPTKPSSGGPDTVTIASGYTVNVQSSLAFAFGDILKMSGTATISVTGNLDMGAIQTADLQITGGNLKATGAFVFGAQPQSMTANVTAASMTLGSGSASTINGTITASGAVAIASSMNINGNISGSVITAGASVDIVGAVTATTSVSIGSGSTVQGDITAPKVDLLASSVIVTGNIVATGAVTIASGNAVNGNVTADNLTMQSSSGYVTGTATARTITLGYQTRIRSKIYCTGGTTAGNCDCVINNSSYPVNSALGPSCSSPGPDHYKITHPVSGPTCAPSTVTITACANAACTAPHYAGGASVTLTPGGKVFTIDSSGVNSAATVEQLSAGTATISNTGSPGGATALVCVGTGGPTTTSDCKITFANSALVLAVPNQVADTSTSFTVTAVKSGANPASCAPAFSGVRSVAFSCTYINPSTGTLPVLVGGTSVACNGTSTAVSLNFASPSGIATSTVKYADVGNVTLAASVASPSMVGSDTFIAAPASFNVGQAVAGNIKAGNNFTATLSARNSSNAVTPNFGRETSPETAKLALTKCSPSGANTGVLSSSIGAFGASVAGTASATLSWTEVGTVDLTATLFSGSYLASGLSASGNSGTGGTLCNTLGNVGPFTPDHFDVAITQTLGFTYSGQPLSLVTVTAENAAGATTLNYNGSGSPSYAKATTFSVFDSAGNVFNPVPGALTASVGAPAGAVVVPASSFVSGVAQATPVYTFSSALTAPTTIRLRATDTDGITSTGGVEGTGLVETGRLRLFGAFGRSSANLSIPMRAEYWTGKSWLLNTLDVSSVPAASVALSPASLMSGTTVVGPIAALVAGQGNIVLKPPSAAGSIGVVDLAVNLGSTTVDVSCLSTHPASTGAAMPWLRSLNGVVAGICTATYDRDPAARATFGVIVPEQKRVIHVREVFR